MSRFMDWINRMLGNEDDEMEDDTLVPSADVITPELSRESLNRPPARKKDISATLTTINNVTVMVISPISFEEAKKTVDYIKNQRPVVANFEDTERTLFQRFIDFVSGAIYSLDGKIEKISQYVFLFAPPNVLINAEDKRKFITESATVNKKTFLDS